MKVETHQLEESMNEFLSILKGGDGQRRGGPLARAGEPGEERGDSRMGRVLILGTSPSQDFLLTMLLPSWFISPRGLLLLESRNVAGFLSQRT